MIRLSFQDNSIIFTFEDSSHYLQGNGVIEAPKGSLALICDESNMANFVKASSNDIFVSATYEELGKTKAQLLETFAENAGSSGGGGDLTNYYTKQETNSLLDEKVDVSAYTAYTSATDTAIAAKASNTDLQSVSGVVDTKLATSDFNTYSAATDSVIASKASNTDLQSVSGVVDTKLATNDFNTYSSATQTTLNGKANASDLQALESVVDTKANASDLDALTSVVNGKADTTAMTQALSTKQDTLVSGTNIKTINNTSILGSGNIEIQVEVDDELDIDSPNAVANSAITKAIQDNELVTANALIALQDDLDDKASQTDLQSVSAATASNTTAIGAINAQLSGYKLAKMTTAEYEALTVKDASTIYFIVD